MEAWHNKNYENDTKLYECINQLTESDEKLDSIFFVSLQN